MLETRPQANPTLRTPDWYKSATRWTQLTLAEDDPEKFDPQFWIEVFRRTRSNATCISAGGYIAYYPSEVPLHYVSRFIGDRDPFGALVEGARSLGMHVMARVDPHAIHQDAADAHPEWVQVQKDGTPRRHWAYPDVWVTNAYGAYNSEFMPEVVREIVRKYDIDAVFANRWQGHGVDYSEDSRRRFRDFSGYELPLEPNAADPVWQAWAAWRRKVLTEVVAQWDDAVKAIRPHASFIPNMSGSSLMEFDLSVIQKHCPFMVVDHQGRRGVEPVWSSGRNGKRIHATFPDRPVQLITSIGPEEEHRWKDAVTTGPEIQAWMTDGAVHGLNPWFAKFNGVVPDQRWVEPVVQTFNLHADIEPYLEGMQATAEIAIIDPSTTLRHWAPEKRHQAETHDLGVYQALIEARLPFDLLSDQVMTPESLDRFKLVILANATCLSDEQCAALRAYVARGGGLVAAYETSLQTESGAARDNFGLTDVFGADLRAPSRGPIKNTYVALADEHPINAGYGGAGRIIGGTHVIAVTPAADAQLPFLFVPDFPDLPMEEVYYRDEPHEGAVIARQAPGGGRTVYIPWNIGQVFWEILAQDHQRLIENAVRWALGKAPRVEVQGKGVVDLAVRESGDAIAVSLVNLTNPMMLKGPIREVFPIGPQRVSIELPAGRTAASARLLVRDQEARVSVTSGRATIEVPGVDLLEVVHLSLA